MSALFSRLLAPALVLAAAAVARANPPGAASMHTLIWSDEFNGTNAAGLDATKWGWGQLPWGGTYHNSSYASTIRAVDSYVDGSGNLVLGVRPGPFNDNNGITHPFSEGMIYSQGKFDFAYGYSEVSAKVSDATGSWPAFWMLMNGWPPEIDVMEWFKSESNRMHTGLAWNNSGATSWDDVNTYDSSVQNTWHTWALDWSPGRLAIYKDGWDQRWATSGDRVPTDPMYFILNSGVQSGQTSWWHDTLFDYVRVWKRNQYVYNGGFETWNGPWTRSGNTSVNGGMGRSGSRGLRLHKDNATDCYADQLIYGLAPNTDYIFTGWGNVGSAAWPYVRIGVKNYGGAEVKQDISSNGFTQATLPFTTGAANTTANVFAYMPTMWGDTVVDDFNVRPAAAITDRGFESADTFYYWTGSGTTYGPQAVVNSNARSGGYCLRFDGAAHAWAGAGEDLAGLRPNTTYELSAWLKTNGQGTKIGVKNYNGTTAEVQATNSSTTAYTRSALTFTTGASNTTATIYAWFNRTDGTAYSYVDDFFLCEPLPSPWAKSDIGTVPFAGDSGARNGQTVIRSGGADIWNAADSMHFVWQALPGSGTITARLRTLENTSGVCKVGVMLRESLLPGAKDIYIGWRGDGKIERIRRNTADTACTSNVGAVMTAPWVKIRRDGDVLTTFYSPDGVTWTAHGSTQTIPMATTVYVGLAASSNDATLVGESSADNVTFQADDYDQDGMPDTWEMAAFGSLTQTANGDSDGDGMTNLQEFLAGTNPTDAASRLTATLSRPSAAAPFTLAWPSVPGKTYTLLYQAALGGAWQTLTTVPAAVAPATSTSYSDATSAGLTQRFYKVQAGP